MQSNPSSTPIRNGFLSVLQYRRIGSQCQLLVNQRISHLTQTIEFVVAGQSRIETDLSDGGQRAHIFGRLRSRRKYTLRNVFISPSPVDVLSRSRLYLERSECHETSMARELLPVGVSNDFLLILDADM